MNGNKVCALLDLGIEMIKGSVGTFEYALGWINDKLGGEVRECELLQTDANCGENLIEGRYEEMKMLYANDIQLADCECDDRDITYFL